MSQSGPWLVRRFLSSRAGRPPPWGSGLGDSRPKVGGLGVTSAQRGAPWTTHRGGSRSASVRVRGRRYVDGSCRRPAGVGGGAGGGHAGRGGGGLPEGRRAPGAGRRGAVGTGGAAGPRVCRRSLPPALRPVYGHPPAAASRARPGPPAPPRVEPPASRPPVEQREVAARSEEPGL